MRVPVLKIRSENLLALNMGVALDGVELCVRSVKLRDDEGLWIATLEIEVAPDVETMVYTGRHKLEDDGTPAPLVGEPLRIEHGPNEDGAGTGSIARVARVTVDGCAVCYPARYAAAVGAPQLFAHSTTLMDDPPRREGEA